MSFNPYLEVLCAAVLWGATGIFIKILHLPSTSLTFFRAGVPVVILYIIFSFQRKKVFKGKHKLMWIASTLNAVRMLLYFIGFSLTAIGNAVIILYTGPIFISLFSALFLREKVTSQKVGVLLMAFFGLVVMYSNHLFSFQQKDFFGMTAVLTSTIMNAVMILLIKKEIHKYTKMETIFWQNLVAVFIFLPFLLNTRPVPTTFQWQTAIIYAFVNGLVAYYMYFSALKKIPLSTATIITYMEVVSAITFAWVFLREPITMNMLVGGFLIISASLLLKKIEALSVTQ